MIHLICTYLQKCTFTRGGPGPTGGQQPGVHAGADRREGRVCVKALVVSFGTAPVPGTTEQSGRALPKTQLRDLYSERARQKQAGTVGARGWPGSRPGSAPGPPGPAQRRPLMTSSPTDRHRRQQRATPQIMGPTDGLRPHRQPQAVLSATGGPTDGHGSHGQPQATPAATGGPTDGYGHSVSRRSHRCREPRQQPQVVPPMPQAHRQPQVPPALWPGATESAK